MSGIIQVTCDRCHFSQRLTERTRRYCLSDRTEFCLEGRLAWCHACRGVVEAEHLTSLEEIDEAIQRTVNREPLILETLALISRTIDEELQELNLIRSWRLQRRSPPKCLACGSPFIEYFQEPSDPITQEEWEEMPHLDCNGRLKAQYVGMALVREWAPSYSAEGDRILK